MKNTTSNTPTQQPEFETDRFASRQTGFWLAGNRCMFQVTTECTAGDVLKQSSALMASTISVFTALSDHDQLNDATAYRLICGMVELQLNVNPGGLASNNGNASGVMTLPAGYRPAVELIAPCSGNQGADLATRAGTPRGVIGTDGTVSIFSYASNENITLNTFFRAG